MTGAASAPGKALLCGEYAVLEGAPAVVAAVDRRVVATWASRVHPTSPEVEATLALVSDRVGVAPGPIEIDVEALQSRGVKLGLGSSAAAAVAAAGAVFSHHGHDLGTPGVVDAVFACALEGHMAVAPSGSGVDVAASAYGGYLRFQRGAGRVLRKPLRPPAGLTLRLIWTGTPVRTSDLVRKVHQFRDRDLEGYRGIVEELSTIGRRFVDAIEGPSMAAVIAEADAYGLGMDALGRGAEAPIVEAKLRRIAGLARAHGGAAKPCGAGGGDVAVAFFEDETSASAFDRACLDAEFTPIEVGWGAAGVRAETPSPGGTP